MGDDTASKPKRKEELHPPTEAVIQLIKQHVTAKWPGMHVGVLWVWYDGQKRLTFKWDRRLGRHVVAKKFGPDDQRILCAMSYPGLITEIDVLSDEKKGSRK